MQPLISIIVPIYNVEQYLDRCVESIVNQTYKNLEIILVDDGSPDSCAQICDAWAEKDDRIKVIHKENGGLSDARNAGLSIANGELISFIDSDDYIAREMLSTMYNVMAKSNVDIVECGIEIVNDEIVLSGGTYDEKIDNIKTATPEEAISQLIDDAGFRQTVWNKLYKRKVIGDILFPFGKLNEDEYWTYKVFAKASSLAAISNPFYKYYQREGSIINSSYSEKRLDAIWAKKERSKFLKEHYPLLYKKSLCDLASTCKYQFQWICRTKDFDKNKDIRVFLFKEYLSVEKKVLKEGEDNKEKIWIEAFRKAPYLTSKIRNVLKIGC